jgi:hypothetical protein
VLTSSQKVDKCKPRFLGAHADRLGELADFILRDLGLITGAGVTPELEPSLEGATHEDSAAALTAPQPKHAALVTVGPILPAIEAFALMCGRKVGCCAS